MEGERLIFLIWGMFAMVMGAIFVVFRHQVSQRARAQQARRGQRLGPNTQSPAVIAGGGALFLVLGIVATTAAALGVTP